MRDTEAKVDATARGHHREPAKAAEEVCKAQDHNPSQGFDYCPKERKKYG
jgi:hypothetical protein